MLPEFESFNKIPRLKRGCIITEKIDGTNAQIYIDDSGNFFTGSRNKWITPEEDNAGFSRWAHEHKDELMKLGPGRHYGEWWGSGIQRRYGLTEKRFSLFNTSRWTPETLPNCASVVSVLYEGDFNIVAIDQTLEKLRNEGSVASPGFMDPEGIIVYHVASRSMYKVTLDGDGHKGT